MLRPAVGVAAEVDERLAEVVVTHSPSQQTRWQAAVVVSSPTRFCSLLGVERLHLGLRAPHVLATADGHT